MPASALDALEAFRSAAEIARELGDAELLARAAIGYEEACWRPGIVDEGAASSCSRRRRRALRRRALGAARRAARRARSGARLPGRPRARGGRPDAARSRWPASSDDRAGLATVLMRSYWSRGTTSLEEILAMLTEARDLGEQLGDTEIRAEAMAWRVPAFVALSRSRVGPQGGRRRCATPPSRRRSRSCSTSPSTMARRSRSGTGVSAEAEARQQRSHEWSRLLTGRDRVRRLRNPDVQHPAGAGPPGGARPGDQDPRRRRDGRARGDPGWSRVLVELGMDEEARRELARVAAQGLEPFRESLWLGVAHLPDRRLPPRSATRRWRRSSTRSSSRSPGRT